MVFSPRKLKSPEKFQDTQIFDKMNAKDFIDCQIKRAENSSIQELKQEIEKDVQLLMSPEYLEDTKYEIFLCNYLKKIEFGLKFYIFAKNSINFYITLSPKIR